MDIWTWVHNRAAHYDDIDPEFADAIDDMSSWVIARDYERVAAALPVVLQKARSYGDPWLEVYFRHWNLQMQIFQRNRVTDLEHEVVDIVNFSHKEETQDCPQSICVVQDFAHYYGLVDGPAYTEERKKIVEETISRINPDWPCYGCLSTEYALALIDEGAADQACDYIKAQVRKMGGRLRDVPDLCLALGEAYLDQMKYDETRDLLSREGLRSEGDVFVTHSNILLAHALAGLGEVKKAQSKLPSFKVIKATRSFFPIWVNASLALMNAAAKAPEHEDLMRIDQMAQELQDNGAFRKSFDLFAILARLYVEAGNREKAAETISRLERVQKNLRVPERLDDQVQLLKASAGLGTPKQQPAEEVKDRPSATGPKKTARR